MFVGGVAEDLIENYPNPSRMRRLQQRVEIRERSIVRMHAIVVRNVIAPVAVRRGVNRRKPDRVDAELVNVVEFRQQSGKVAVSVAVSVAKTADIHLINNGATPPWRARRRTHTSLA